LTPGVTTILQDLPMRFEFTLPLLALSAIPAFSQDTIDFNRDIRPILSDRCFTCHGPDEKQLQADLRLDLRQSAVRNRDGRAAIVPGSTATSELLLRVDADDDAGRMPPPESGNRLTASQRELLRKWILQGADYAQHWSYSKPVRTTPPKVLHEQHVRNPIDRFILRQLEEQHLNPSAQADRYTLIRRLSLDLTGLPPTIERSEQFAHDPDPAAYETLVDELLADDAYGERWATMWLDLARYADSAGYANDPPRTIWLYRDWVIRAINSNLPFDQFTVEQIAGDLLPDPTRDQLIATAFHRNTLTNSEGGTNDEEFRNAAIIDRVNTSMQVWMGTTIACAQCHNHKFDPISQEEFFRLFAILNNTQDSDRADEAPVLSVVTEEQSRQKDAWTQQIADLKNTLYPSGEAFRAAVRNWESRARKPVTWKELTPLAASSVGTALSVRIDRNGKPVQEESETAVLNLEVETDLRTITGFRIDAPANSSTPTPGQSRVALTGFSVEAIKGQAAARRGRFVRVSLPGTGRFLHLAEVQVISGGKNVAPSGKARQSSTAFNGPAEAGNDGNTDGTYANGSVTHTAQETNPWWEVDLGSETDIDRIAVFNRTDGSVGPRLNGYIVSILDDARKEIWSQTFAKAPAVAEQISVSGFSPVVFSPITATAGTVRGNSEWTLTTESSTPAFAVLTPVSPLKADGLVTLRFRITQNVRKQGQLHQFRLSATQSTGLIEALPEKLSRVLSTPPGQRTSAQLDILHAKVRSTLTPDKTVQDQIAKIEKQIAGLKGITVPVLKELPQGKRRKTFIQIRGNFLVTDKEVSAGVPAIFHAFPKGTDINRLGFARWLVHPDNPLTARVVVNRYWEQLFGTGLVKTSEEFGNQGEPPSHPELLDWLALEFSRTWDVKALIKMIVMSGTYRQSSQVTPGHTASDPFNRLLGRAPSIRLTAEMVRDQALAVAGLLSRKMHGVPVRPPRPMLGLKAAFGSSTDWSTSTGEDRYRRGLYTQWRRSLPYPSMATFDAPNRNVCTIRRAPTNTPLQALVTLNDPVYIEAAQGLARRIAQRSLDDNSDAVSQRVRYGFQLSLTRPPTQVETDRLTQLYHHARDQYSRQPDQARLLATDPLGPLPDGFTAVDLAAWTLVSNVLLNLDEALVRK